MTRIILADDHRMIRKGIRGILSLEADLEVIGEASDGLQTVEIAEALKPDILVLDLMMPGLNGLKVAARLAKSCPQISIIMLSMHSNEAYVAEAVHLGVKGYVLKDNTSDELVPAIRHVAAGKQFLSSSLMRQPKQAQLSLDRKTP